MALPQAIQPRLSQFLTLALMLSAGSIRLPAQSVYGMLTSTPSTLQFSSVAVGGSQTLTVQLSNTGAATLTMTRMLVSAPWFLVSNLNFPLSLAPGKQVPLSITFQPLAVGPAGGTIAFFSNYASDSVLFLTFSGTGVASTNAPAIVQVAPPSRNFGNVKVGNSKSLTETITNAGTSPLSISQVALTGGQFSISGLNLPLALGAGESFTFQLSFAPNGSGSATGTLSVIPLGSGSPVSVALTGTGTSAGALSLSPASLSFGNVSVGKSSSTPVTLSATGFSVTVNSATLNSSEFSLSGVSFPLTIAAGKSSTFNVVFTPQSSGAATGKITFASTANAPAEKVSGSGVAGTQHQVALSWAGSSSTVEGYNVYRGTVSGGPYARVNSSVDTNTSYTDSTVLGGTTYYYATTAVGTDGVESSYSNQVKVAIPSP